MNLRLIENGNNNFAIELQIEDNSWKRVSRWFVFRVKAIAYAQGLFDKELENELARQITVLETYSGSTT